MAFPDPVPIRARAPIRGIFPTRLPSWDLPGLTRTGSHCRDLPGQAPISWDLPGLSTSNTRTGSHRGIFPTRLPSWDLPGLTRTGSHRGTFPARLPSWDLPGLIYQYYRLTRTTTYWFLSPVAAGVKWESTRWLTLCYGYDYAYPRFAIHVNNVNVVEW